MNLGFAKRPPLKMMIVVVVVIVVIGVAVGLAGFLSGRPLMASSTTNSAGYGGSIASPAVQAGANGAGASNPPPPFNQPVISSVTEFQTSVSSITAVSSSSFVPPTTQ